MISDSSEDEIVEVVRKKKKPEDSASAAVTTARLPRIKKRTEKYDRLEEEGDTRYDQSRKSTYTDLEGFKRFKAQRAKPEGFKARQRGI